MLLSLIYFLPCIVSLLWFFSFVMKKKNHRQRMFCYAQGLSVVLYAILGIYFFPDVDYYTMVRMETVSIPFGVLFPAFIVAYLYMHCFDRKLNENVRFALLIPAIVVCVAINLLCYIIGFDKAAMVSQMFASPEGLTGALDTRLNHMYCFFTYDIFMIIEGCYILLIYCLCCGILHRQGYRFGDVFRFFFRGKATTSSRTIAVLYMVEMTVMIAILLFGGIYMTNHVALCVFLMVILATVKHLIAHVEFYSNDNSMMTLYDLSHLTLFVEKDEEETEDTDAAEELNATTQAQRKMEVRYEQFRELMEVKEVWRDEDLTAARISDMMGVGKTTLSSIIAQYYETPLRDIINRYRIEESKRYMTANPKANQETVALHCGFKTAQYFNTQFKKFVGETPTVWLASNVTSH